MDKSQKLAIFIVILLFALSLLTTYYGSTDVQEYAGSAKFFAGKYNADLRASHSVLYGYIHSPLLRIFDSFTPIKFMNLIYLTLIILSVYYISDKDKKALILIVTAPAVWYLGPWINPIQISSLFFLWGYFFITKFQSFSDLKYLVLSGILVGLSAAFWNTALYIGIILGAIFLINKNINYSFIFLFGIIIGLLPLFILEQYLFGFFLYSFVKTNASNLVAFVSGSIYEGVDLNKTSLIFYLTFILMLPYYIYVLYKKDKFLASPRSIIFLTISILFFALNPQPRYLLLIYPIIILILSKNLSNSQFNRQIAIFIIISIAISAPYVMQAFGTTNSKDFRYTIKNMNNWDFQAVNTEKQYNKDISKIAQEFPNQAILVGPKINDYSKLALAYWGPDVKEFVSLEDYQLHEESEKTLFSKRFSSKSRIQNRRQIWIQGGIDKNPEDTTNYDDIKYAVTINGALELKGFKQIKKYTTLRLYGKQTQ